MEKKKTSWHKVLLTVLCVIVCLVLLLLIGVRMYFRLPVSSYYGASEKGFKIPGIADGFIAQGISYDKERGVAAVTGYTDKKGEPSPLYIVDIETKKTVKKVVMERPDGKMYTGHGSGVVMHGGLVYVSGTDYLYVFSLDDIMNAENGGKVKSVGRFEGNHSDDDYVRASFVATDGEKLYIGEFYREKSNDTADTHKLTTKSGDYNQALMLAYRFSDGEGSVLGLEAEPCEAYSLPNYAQGMCFLSGKIYLSTSYGLTFSHIYVYEKEKLERQDDIDIIGLTLPLYALDRASLKHDIKVPPMSEEIEVINGKIYIMCESASNKYIFGKLTGGEWCYATDFSKLEK